MLFTKRRIGPVVLTAAAATACLPLVGSAQDARNAAESYDQLVQGYADAIRQVQDRAAQPIAPQTYLGVALRPVDPDQAAQLGQGVPDGVGLGVAHVDPESPAAAAGLRDSDVIVKLGDQWAVNPEQFTTLVRGLYKPGQDAAVTVARDGEQKTLDVTFVEKELPLSRPNAMREFGAFPMGDPFGGMGEMPNFAPDAGRMREQLELLQRRMDEAFGEEAAGRPRFRLGEGFRLKPPMALDGVAEGSRVVIADGQTTSTLTADGEDFAMRVQDAAGEVLYDGPFPADEAAMKDLPPRVRDAAEQLRKFVPARAKDKAPSTRPAAEDGRERAKV